MILTFDDVVVNNNKIWFSANNINGLFCYDIVTKQIERKAVLGNETSDKMHLFDDFFCIDNYLVLTPNTSKTIILYDIKNEVMEYYEVPNSEKGAFLYGGFVYKKDIYFSKVNQKGLYKFNIQSKKIEKKDILYNLETDIKMRDNRLWGGRWCWCDDSVFLNLYQNSLLIEYDLANQKSYIHNVCDENVIDIAYFKDKLWIVTDKAKIICWDMEHEQKKPFIIENKNICDLKKYRFYIDEDNLYILGIYRNGEVLKFSEKDKVFEKIFPKVFMERNVEEKSVWNQVLSLRTREELFFQYSTGEFYKKKSLEGKCLDAINININNYVEKYNLFYKEIEYFALKDFLELG